MPKTLLAVASLLAIHAAFGADPLGEQLLDATRKGDTVAVKALLDKGANVNSKNRYGSTPLFFACDRGNLEMATLLIERGANLNVKDTFYNATALSWAMNKKHGAVVALLIEKGVDVADAFQQSVQSNDMRLFQLVLDKGRLTASGLDDALLLAKFLKRDEMAKALLAKSAKDIEIAVDPAALGKYAGKYQEGEMTMTFAVKDGKLGLVQGANTAPLLAIAPDKFRYLPSGLDFQFVKSAADDSVIESVKFASRGGEQELMRAK